MEKSIKPIDKFDWPAGYQDTGLTKQRIEPDVHPENLAFLVKKLNEVITKVNLLMGD